MQHRAVDLMQLLGGLGAGPEAELLADALVEAMALAAAGRAPDGYEVLLLGRHTQRARLTASAPWAAELMAGWQYALDRFAQEFGVARA